MFISFTINLRVTFLVSFLYWCIRLRLPLSSAMASWSFKLTTIFDPLLNSVGSGVDYFIRNCQDLFSRPSSILLSFSYNFVIQVYWGAFTVAFVQFHQTFFKCRSVYRQVFKFSRVILKLIYKSAEFWCEHSFDFSERLVRYFRFDKVIFLDYFGMMSWCCQRLIV